MTRLPCRGGIYSSERRAALTGLATVSRLCVDLLFRAERNLLAPAGAIYGRQSWIKTDSSR